MSSRSWFAGISFLVVAACSSSDTHPPGAGTDCTSHCDPVGTTPGSKNEDAGKRRDSGSTSSDASIGGGFGCFTDPTFGIRLCRASTLCTGVVIDPTSQCGYLDSPSGAIDVECICNNTLLCPITRSGNCQTLPGLLSQQSLNPVCSSPAVTSACLNLADLAVKKDGSTCSMACVQSCGGFTPACLAGCGC